VATNAVERKAKGVAQTENTQLTNGESGVQNHELRIAKTTEVRIQERKTFGISNVEQGTFNVEAQLSAPSTKSTLSGVEWANFRQISPVPNRAESYDLRQSGAKKGRIIASMRIRPSSS
jgi:hypothetical protein